jgi:hypothetical protein
VSTDELQFREHLFKKKGKNQTMITVDAGTDSADGKVF